MRSFPQQSEFDSSILPLWFYNMFYFTFSDPQNLRVTVNHSLSEDTCNQQCIGGCNGTSHLNCFACKRVMDQLSDGRKNCIEQCPDGLLLVRKFCCLLVCQLTKFITQGFPHYTQFWTLFQSSCVRTDLTKRFFPRPKTTTA